MPKERKPFSLLGNTDDSLAAASKAIQSTVQDIKDNVTVSFVIADTSALSVSIECTSKWPKNKVDPVCEAFGANFKKFLNTSKS